MDWCLIGFWLFEWSSWAWIVDPQWWLVILLVALGLGTVIFVHELGHFVVAKLCGVKCEKFYLGFDIAGWKICRFQWGETEYGIGVLPLGGYVKMLGQEDNPARLKEEIERAKAVQALGIADSQDNDEPPIDLAEAEAALYDPRSYLAQSVPKRMAIISAGVVMNMIFAFLVATTAYLIGVNQIRCEVGSIEPGEPAWAADVRPGDRMIEVNHRPTYRFRDLFARIPLSNEEDGVSMLIERPGVDEPFELTLHPNRDRLLPAVGVGQPSTTTLQKPSDWLGGHKRRAYVPGTAVARATPAFKLGDVITKINDQPVKTAPQLVEALAARRDQPIVVTVQRPVDDKGKTEQLKIKVDPQPMRRTGMILEMGPITAIQEGSPAAGVDLRPGDELVAVDGQPVGDPMTLGDELWSRVNQAVADGQSPPTVTLTVKRTTKVKDEEGKETEQDEKTIEVPVALRQTNAYEAPSGAVANGSVSVPALGIAYKIRGKVADVIAGSPAALAGITAGDVLTAATTFPPDEEILRREGYEPGDLKKGEFDLVKNPHDWPRVFAYIQGLLPEAEVELEFEGDKTVKFVPMSSPDWFNPRRGFVLEPLQFTLTAKSLGEAVRLGAGETWEQAGVMLRTIKKLVTGGLSAKLVGGPITIAQVAAASASRGLSDFLLFLVMISVMLAVINFLPIPVLDGGHFVFLLYEGIRGKPVDERIQLALSYVGLLLILALMVWAIGLDTSLISRE